MFSETNLLAEGSYCQLHKAMRHGQWWVLKSLKPEHRGNPVYELLLRKEYDITTQLSHPYIIKAIAFEPVDTLGNCIVMEYIDGETLGNISLSRSQKRNVITQMLDAVEYIHAKQIVHRDLKPENILVAYNGKNIKLIDFGLADADSYAILKQPAGTKGYTSPEQASSNIPDIRNDIYSIGMILKQMQPGIMFRRVINRCLADAGRRYANTHQLRDALTKARRSVYAIVAMAFIAIAASLIIMTTHTPMLQQQTATPATLQNQEKLPTLRGNVDEVGGKGFPATPATPRNQEKLPTLRVKEGGEVYPVWKAEIDNFMQKHKYNEIRDNAPLSVEASRLIGQTDDLRRDIVNRYAKDMDSSQRQKFDTDVATYIGEKYIGPLAVIINRTNEKRINEINNEGTHKGTMQADGESLQP